ncbi:calmodulin [Vigna unguiculata]|uniref:Calmodulin n=1 Tax=Vigna unguiculata TaxID=3917 RepID=A0A4D6NX36_VIGUN|nr:calmodulin [Vigna unguiculata]
MAFIERNVSSDGKRVMTVEQFRRWLTTAFDTNGDGRISKAELRRAVRLTGGLFASWSSGQVFRSADADHDGFIDENEFRNLAQFADKHFNVMIIR